MFYSKSYTINFKLTWHMAVWLVRIWLWPSYVTCKPVCRWPHFQHSRMQLLVLTFWRRLTIKYDVISNAVAHMSPSRRRVSDQSEFAIIGANWISLCWLKMLTIPFITATNNMVPCQVAWNHAPCGHTEPLHSIGPYEIVSFASLNQINRPTHRMWLLAGPLASKLILTMDFVYIIINVRTS